MRAHDIEPEIEAFDLNHIFQAAAMYERGESLEQSYVQFVMGVKNAMPVDRTVFDFYVQTTRRLFGNNAPWCAAGIGANQILLNEWAISVGGHAHARLEDNVRPDRICLALSNAALVQGAVALCETYECPVATWQQTRRFLGLAMRD